MGTNSWTRGDGPLVPFAVGFRKALLARGYLAGTADNHLLLMGRLNRWLDGLGLGCEELTLGRSEEFLAHARQSGRRSPTMTTLTVLLDHLRDLAVLPAQMPTIPSAGDELLSAYRVHLIQARGLAPTTVLRYERFARRFLTDRASHAGANGGVEALRSTDVNTYLLQCTSRLSLESAKREAADLRALLRFLYVKGVVAADLGSSMPPIATWRGGRLPTGLTPAEVESLLNSCDLETPGGLRDHTILTLLGRLGLRATEVAAVQLGDINWRDGEILVRGKARRWDRLPLPVLVGESLVAYLQRGRPTSSSAALILTLYAPHLPIHPCAVTTVTYRACRRAGLPRSGAHGLRHALATDMLRRGGNLVEIAQVLRHSDLATTSGYAKVDRAALRTVAQMWPGATL